MELISFLEAHRVLCFGFVAKTVYNSTMFFWLLLSSACSALRLSVFLAQLPQQVGRECTRNSLPLPQTCQVCSSHTFLLDYIIMVLAFSLWSEWDTLFYVFLHMYSCIYIPAYSYVICCHLPHIIKVIPVQWYLSWCPYFPTISLCCSSMLSSVCGTGFGWWLLPCLSNSLSVLIFALTGLLCNDKFPPLEISAEPAIQYNHMQTTYHLVQESEPLPLQ